MKRLLIIAMVLLTAGVNLSAQGFGQWMNEDSEYVELTGKIQFQFGPHSILVADGKDYELMVPGRMLSGVEITNGQTISVKGYAAEGHRPGGTEDSLYVKVTELEVNGKTYVFPAANCGPGSRGGRHRDRGFNKR